MQTPGASPDRYSHVRDNFDSIQFSIHRGPQGPLLSMRNQGKWKRVITIPASGIGSKGSSMIANALRAVSTRRTVLKPSPLTGILEHDPAEGGLVDRWVRESFPRILDSIDILENVVKPTLATRLERVSLAWDFQRIPARLVMSDPSSSGAGQYSVPVIELAEQCKELGFSERKNYLFTIIAQTLVDLWRPDAGDEFKFMCSDQDRRGALVGAVKELLLDKPQLAVPALEFSSREIEDFKAGCMKRVCGPSLLQGLGRAFDTRPGQVATVGLSMGMTAAVYSGLPHSVVKALLVESGFHWAKSILGTASVSEKPSEDLVIGDQTWAGRVSQCGPFTLIPGVQGCFLYEKSSHTLKSITRSEFDRVQSKQSESEKEELLRFLFDHKPELHDRSHTVIPFGVSCLLSGATVLAKDFMYHNRFVTGMSLSLAVLDFMGAVTGKPLSSQQWVPERFVGKQPLLTLSSLPYIMGATQGLMVLYDSARSGLSVQDPISVFREAVHDMYKGLLDAAHTLSGAGTVFPLSQHVLSRSDSSIPGLIRTAVEEDADELLDYMSMDPELTGSDLGFVTCSPESVVMVDAILEGSFPDISEGQMYDLGGAADCFLRTTDAGEQFAVLDQDTNTSWFFTNILDQAMLIVSEADLVDSTSEDPAVQFALADSDGSELFGMEVDRLFGNERVMGAMLMLFVAWVCLSSIDTLVNVAQSYIGPPTSRRPESPRLGSVSSSASREVPALDSSGGQSESRSKGVLGHLGNLAGVLRRGTSSALRRVQEGRRWWATWRGSSMTFPVRDKSVPIEVVTKEGRVIGRRERTSGAGQACFFHTRAAGDPGKGYVVANHLAFRRQSAEKLALRLQRAFQDNESDNAEYKQDSKQFIGCFKHNVTALKAKVEESLQENKNSHPYVGQGVFNVIAEHINSGSGDMDALYARLLQRPRAGISEFEAHLFRDNYPISIEESILLNWAIAPNEVYRVCVYDRQNQCFQARDYQLHSVRLMAAPVIHAVSLVNSHYEKVTPPS